MGFGFVPTNRKPTYDFPLPFYIKFCSICRRLVAIPMSNYGTPILPPFGVTVGLGGRKWYQSKCHPHMSIRLLYALDPIFLSCAVCHNTQRSRYTTDRAIRIGDQCYSPPPETVTDSSNRILISCKLIAICQLCFWHFAKFQGQTVKVNFLALMP